MREIASWPRPEVPKLPGKNDPIGIFDGRFGEVRQSDNGETATLYVCGITPYDATHLGHAATYIAFDTLQRAWLDAGLQVRTAQNVTDVDDPLFERANATGADWRALAKEQTDLFRADMTALRVIPPDHYVRVQDAIDEIASAVAALIERDLAYDVPIDENADPKPVDENARDIYFDLERAQRLPGVLQTMDVSRFEPIDLEYVFREFGGDPDRPGKRGRLDPLLWRAARQGEPAWETSVGLGRPGWHIECACIASSTLGETVTVQGGGRDLTFPHHEMSAQHASALTGKPFARTFLHAGLIAYRGEKMSKSLGNLVLVSKLVEAGVDPAAIRLAILSHRYSADWEWTDGGLATAAARLGVWRNALRRLRAGNPASAEVTLDADPSPTLTRMRAALANDLDTPAAIAAVDAWAENPAGQRDVPAAVDALLGIRL